MKLLLFSSGHRSHLHVKNRAALERMCASCGIEFEYTSSLGRVQHHPGYDILFATNEFVDIATIPPNVKVIYGPQFWVFPEGSIVGPIEEEYASRSVYNCLSQWVKNVFIETTESLRTPLVPLPFSVDTARFKPAHPREEPMYDCIVYLKGRPASMLQKAQEHLDQRGLRYKVFRYGSYNEAEYLHALQHTRWFLSIDAYESQGFALEEAMATNVPLLVLDGTSMYDYVEADGKVTYENKRPLVLSATAVPYWSEGETGLRITSMDDLPSSIDRMMATYTSYRPRDYILRTLSDEVCMRRMLNAIGVKC